jgi:nitroimidazol reductase NimA-like FMN-containing flavoprotein (pyridoxamine 5'-phosphate oxidase superfamily)
LDEHGLEVIGAAESRALLQTRTVGRLGTSIDALPVIVPVHYAVDGNYVVLRSKAGTPLDKALTDCVVCLEVDTLDDSKADFAWGVIVTGPAERVDDKDDIARLETLGVPDLIAGTHWVRIPTNLALGRRLLTKV